MTVDLKAESCYCAAKRLAVAIGKRLFLRLGDKVTHRGYGQWGVGVVEEVMTSSVPGGTCLTRIRFQDGRLRVFDNDLDSERCCYYFGIRHYWHASDRTRAIRANLLLNE